MFIPPSSRIEVRPLDKDSVIIDDKQELVELGEIVSISFSCRLITLFRYSIGDIIAFEGWGCTKITYNGEDKWVVSTNKNVILGKFTKE